MTNAQIYLEVYQEMGDPQGAVYSVWDLTNAFNFVIRNVSNALPRSGSEFKAYADLTVVSGMATLPADFLAANSIWNGSNKLSQVVADEDIDLYTYDIYGSTLHVDDSITTVKMYYKGAITTLTCDSGAVPSGDFPLADYYTDLTKRYASLYLRGVTPQTELIASINEDVRYIGAGRDKTKINPRLSFYV